MIELNEHIRHLYSKFLTNSLSDSELAEFKEWMDSKPKHKKFCASSVELIQVNEQIKALRHIDKELLWNELQKKKVERNIRKKQRIIWSAAASIAILMGLFSAWLMPNETNNLSAMSQLHERIGSRQSTLSLDNGVCLELAETDTLMDFGSYKIHVLDGTFIYQQADMDADDGLLSAYNTICVPLGAEYKVILPDGTKINLNSGSTLRFPVAFRNNRNVAITGEGYFDVAKDPEHPFTVTTREDIKIRVIGTKFNISAYSSEPVTTTLVEGKIEVISRSGKKIITPSTQAIITENRDTVVSCPNIREEISWAEGTFCFNDMPLKDIIHKLSRWYNMNIRFENEETANIRFTGTVARDRSLGYIMDLLQQISNISYEVKDNEVTIKNNVIE